MKITDKIYRPNGYAVSEAYIFLTVIGKVEVSCNEYANKKVGDFITIKQKISKISKTITYELLN